MVKIVHLIPHDDIGGVEIAAHSMPDGRYPRFEYCRDYIFSGTGHALRGGVTQNPLAIPGSIWKYVRSDVDVLIVSLWRAALVGLCVKIIKPKMQLVLFIHNARDAHFVDYVVTRLAARAADRIWSDSEASWKSRLSPELSPRPRTISFLA